MANKSVGLLTIAFGADLRGFDKAMKKAQRSIKKFGTSMQRTGQTLTRNLTVPLVGLGVAAVKMASDFEETDAKFKTVFSSIQREAEATAKVFKSSFGLSSKAAKQMLGDTGDLLVGFGFTEREALNLSKQVNELAVDLASFTNFSGGAEGASLALTKALLGERESIKSLGIAITEADLKSFAEDQGKVFKQLTRVEKATLTYQLALKQSSKAVGDFARTSGGFANQTRILIGEINDLGIELGQHLLPIANKLLAWSRNLIRSFSNLTAVQKQNAIEWGLILAAIGPVLNLFGTFINLMVGKLIPFLFTTTGLIAGLGAAFILLYNNIGLVTTRIANTFANEFDAAFFTALGAAMKVMGLAGADAFIKLGAKMAAVVATGKDLPEEEFKSFGDIIKDLAKDFKELTGVGSLFGGMGGMNFDNGQIPFLSAINPEKLIGPLNQVGETIAELTQKQKQFNAAMGMFENIMTSAMTSAAYSTEGFFKSFMNNIKIAIKQLLVQLAVITAIKFLIGGPGVAGSLSKAFELAKGKVLGLATGGLVTGPTMALVGEGAGTTASNPEVVAPLDKLKGMINGGGSQQVEVYGRISGNDIFISNQRGSLNRQRSV
jgi:hypothetical protein